MGEPAEQQTNTAPLPQQYFAPSRGDRTSKTGLPRRATPQTRQTGTIQRTRPLETLNPLARRTVCSRANARRKSQVAGPPNVRERNQPSAIAKVASDRP